MPTFATLERICNAFGITLAQFFTVTGSTPDLSKEQAELLEAWNNLKLEERRFVKTFMESMKNKE